MTQQEKQLLLKDLSTRLPYGVKVKINSKPRKVIGVYDEYVVVKGRTDGETSWDNYGIEGYNIKPYLRPISSMTEEERDELREFCGKEEGILYDIGISGAINAPAIIDYLNARHFDFRNLIEKGLAIEAPEGMYETEKV